MAWIESIARMQVSYVRTVSDISSRKDVDADAVGTSPWNASALLCLILSAVQMAKTMATDVSPDVRASKSYEMGPVTSYVRSLRNFAQHSAKKK